MERIDILREPEIHLKGEQKKVYCLPFQQSIEYPEIDKEGETSNEDKLCVDRHGECAS